VKGVRELAKASSRTWDGTANPFGSFHLWTVRSHGQPSAVEMIGLMTLAKPKVKVYWL
jgi:hypothetical protein